MGQSHTRNLETAKPQKRRNRKLTAGAASVAAALLAATLAVSSGPATAQGSGVTYVTVEPVGGDIASNEDTLGIVRVGTTSTGQLTHEHDNDPAYHLGDWWRLDVSDASSSRRYLVEVAFGSTVTAAKGGGLEVYHTDWDGSRIGRGDLWDHNRDDGAAFIFMNGDRRPTFLSVWPRDFLNEGSLTYHGNYTITLTDITDAETQLDNTRHDDGSAAQHLVGHQTLLGTLQNLWRASSFTTGSNTGGYRLEWLQTSLVQRFGPNLPQLALYTNSSSAPGTKVFDFIAPAAINTHPSPRGQDFALAPNIPAATLTANTTYWVVAKETSDDTSSQYTWPVEDNGDTGGAVNPGWSYGGTTTTYDLLAGSPAWASTGFTDNPALFSVHAVNVGGA